MGDFNVKPIANNRDRAEFYSKILRDLKCFESLLDQGIIEDRGDMIGAEQEMCLVDDIGMPASKAIEVLSQIEDARFTNELALYDMEINLTPRPLKGTCFSDVENELASSMKIAEKSAQKYGCKPYLTGMLQTIGFRHLMFDHMTPEERYRMLSEELLKLRGKSFEIALEGIDDFQATLDSVLFEACNTSFQTHLQVAPSEFVEQHNWAQMISGPVMSVAVNSPLLFGKELWSENRIALFKQSLDTRGEKNHSLETVPRVYFGRKWITESPAELWRENIVRFPLLLKGYGEDDPFKLLSRGVVPKLKSLGLHNGTTYTWNRLCYGVHDNSPHIRIECRYLPSGPTMVDEVANFAFWVGLMKGQPDELKGFWKSVDFRIAKANFVNASRTGLLTVLHWFGKNYSARDLVLDTLLPIAKSGLEKMKINSGDIEKYLGIISDRVTSEKTGAQWQKNNHRVLRKKYRSTVASKLLVQYALSQQKRNLPVHDWSDIILDDDHNLPKHLDPTPHCIEDIMNKDVISVRDNVSVDVAKRIMEWKQINHIPVDDEKGRLVGILSSTTLDRLTDNEIMIKDVMTYNVIAVQPFTKLEDAKTLLIKNKIGSLPVVEKGILVGIVSAKDFPDYRPL